MASDLYCIHRQSPSLQWLVAPTTGRVFPFKLLAQIGQLHFSKKKSEGEKKILLVFFFKKFFPKAAMPS